MEGFDHRFHSRVKGVKTQLLLSIANCYWKMQNFREVVNYCTLSLDIERANSKPLLKRGLAHAVMGLYEDAHQDLREAHQLDPDDLVIIEELRKLESKVNGLY